MIDNLLNEIILKISVKKSYEKRVKASYLFVEALALVSILGFLGIVSRTLFEREISLYIEAFWMLIIGVGLIIEGQISTLRQIRYQGLTPTNFAHLTTVIVGTIAIFAGLVSLTQVGIESSSLNAVKGIVSLIAIIVIVIQTWVVK